MRELIQSRNTLVWLVLMTATAMSLLLGAHPGSADDPQLGSAVMLLVAFVKVRLVVVHFMEIHHAPWTLRWSADVSVASICTAVLLFYLYGEHLVAAGFPVS
jgi:hypothetical protein